MIRLVLTSVMAAVVSGSILLSMFALSSCAGQPPPSLTPQATVAWYGTQLIKDLDLLRDVVIDANAQVPPLVSTVATREVVRWHKSAITLVHEAPSEWQVLLLKGLYEVIGHMPPHEYRIVLPYVELIKTILNEI